MSARRGGGGGGPPPPWGTMEAVAAGQIALSHADCTGGGEAGDEATAAAREPRSQRTEAVSAASAAAVINLKKGTVKPRPGGGQGRPRV